MKVFVKTAIRHLLCFWISILVNIFHKHEKTQDTDFHLMSMEHDQYRKPMNSKIMFIYTNISFSVE